MPAARAAGFVCKRTGGEWDVCHWAEFHRAAMGQHLVEVAARLSWVVW